MNWVLLDYFYPKYFNLGDYIQTVIVKQLIQSIDKTANFQYAVREKIGLKNSISHRKLNFIAQGWFSHLESISSTIPNPRYINSLYLGFHAEHCLYSRINSIIASTNFDIGCRDLSTYDQFKDYKKAYFSRCLTLLYDPFENIEKTDDIYIVSNSPNTFKNYLHPDIWNRAKIVDHYQPNPTIDIQNHIQYYEQESLNNLRKYNSAKLVITNLLHCATPCIAMHTPVIFINSNIQNRATSLAGIVPTISYNDLSKLTPQDINNIQPVEDIEDLKKALKYNFTLSCDEAFFQKRISQTEKQDCRNYIKEFISKNYYDNCLLHR